MKYKVGDKVIIKTLEEMEREYGLTSYGQIKTKINFLSIQEEQVVELNTDRILEIRAIGNDYYCMQKIGHWWTEDMIKCSSVELEKTWTPIQNRFEILDL